MPKRFLTATVLLFLVGFGLPAAVLADQRLPEAKAKFPKPDAARVALGQLLFYDPILSGSKTVSCATCHHPNFATGDGVALSLGDGGVGLGPDRVPDPNNYPEERIPRNAPALFNLGASEFTTFFHDGRLEADASRKSGIRTPLGEDMADGFASPLSAQAMFPVLSPDEMAGHYAESDVSKSVRSGRLTHSGGAWEIIAARVSAIPDYAEAFAQTQGERPIQFTDISDRIADFMAFEWRADQSAFDRHLRGEAALEGAALRGLDLFYGKGGCSVCHSGQFQTDHQFHAIAMPQIGPGKKSRFEDHFRDEGRMLVTGRVEDAYSFRTPSLRNVTKTAPYGHSGAYASLEGVIRHHLDPITSLRTYDRSQIELVGLQGAEDWQVLDDPIEMGRIEAANDLEPVRLSDAQVDAIIAFLGALTDTESLAGRLGIPKTVPSGLPVDR